MGIRASKLRPWCHDDTQLQASIRIQIWDLLGLVTSGSSPQAGGGRWACQTGASGAAKGPRFPLIHPKSNLRTILVQPDSGRLRFPLKIKVVGRSRAIPYWSQCLLGQGGQGGNRETGAETAAETAWQACETGETNTYLIKDIKGKVLIF